MATPTVHPAVSRALSRLVLSQPWFASLALRLRVKVDPSIPTACVDGVTLRYNPEWFGGLDVRFQEGVLAHEVMHCALLHMTRRGSRDASLWNQAGDHVINLELEAAGFRLPADCLKDPQYRGLSSEQVYAALQHNQQGGGGQEGTPYVDPLGGVADAPQDGPQPSQDGAETTAGDKAGKGAGTSPGDLETDWQVATAQASMVAAKAGKLPGGVDRVTRATLAGEKDWREVMQNYLTLPGDYAWTRPNRRMVSRGLYLPGAVKDRPGTVVFMGDGSGSITAELYDAFAMEAGSILNAAGWPERVVSGVWDTEVRSFVDCASAEEIRESFRAEAGGGTMAGPIFERIADEGMEPTVLFILTDMELGDWHTLAEMGAPPYPVVWVAPEWAYGHGRAPWGETVYVPMSGR